MLYIFQEEILKYLSTLMDNCRQEFTRLYFLSNEELVEMMGISRNPQALQPFAKKCFPGIDSLAFALPPGTSSLNTHLDFALHGNCCANFYFVFMELVIDVQFLCCFCETVY